MTVSGVSGIIDILDPRASAPTRRPSRAISTPSCSCSPRSSRTRTRSIRSTPTSSPSSWCEFSGVEQQLKTNDFLSSLVARQRQHRQLQRGRAISARPSPPRASAPSWSTARRSGTSTLTDAANVTVNIKDANGNIVYTETGPAAGRRRHLHLGRHRQPRQHQARRHLLDLDAGRRRRGQDRQRLDPDQRRRHRRRLHRHRAGAAASATTRVNLSGVTSVTATTPPS